MGVFAELLHIRPWEMELLTEREFLALVRYLDDKNDDK